jgi:hypothetical protein
LGGSVAVSHIAAHHVPGSVSGQLLANSYNGLFICPVQPVHLMGGSPRVKYCRQTRRAVIRKLGAKICKEGNL